MNMPTNLHTLNMIDPERDLAFRPKTTSTPFALSTSIAACPGAIFRPMVMVITPYDGKLGHTSASVASGLGRRKATLCEVN